MKHVEISQRMGLPIIRDPGDYVGRHRRGWTYSMRRVGDVEFMVRWPR